MSESVHPLEMSSAIWSVGAKQLRQPANQDSPHTCWTDKMRILGDVF